MAYLFKVPANRIRHPVRGIGELEILREIIALSVFAPLSPLYPKEPVKLDHPWAGLCLVGAAFFIFRHHLAGRRAPGAALRV